jgi:cytochrome c-type biogenesis protein CcmH
MTVLLSMILALSLAPAQRAPDLEIEARAIDAMLIAPCCFRQQVSLHQSAAADEVRLDVRARLAAGQSRQRILDAYVARYGKQILVEPPAVGFDRSLFVMPVVTLVLSAGLVAALLRRFTRPRLSPAPGVPDAAALAAPSPADQVRLDDELRDLD